MTRKEIVDAVAKKHGYTQADVNAIMLAVLDEIKEAVALKKSVFLRNFGTFSPKKRKAKIAQNITLGQSIQVPERTVPHFKPCESFQNAVNNS